MGIVQQSMIAAILKNFLVTTSALLLLMTLGGGVNEAIRKGLPVSIALQLIPLLIPEMLRFVVPGCMLFAVCSVFARRAADNELVALKAAGISLWKVIWPVLVVAYLLSIGTFMLYDACAIWSRPGMKQLLISSVDDVALSVLRTQRSFRKDDLSIVVKGMNKDTLISPVVHVMDELGKPQFTMLAESARLTFDDKIGKFRFEGTNGRVRIGAAKASFPGQFSHEIPLGTHKQVPDEALSPAALRSSSITTQIQYEHGKIAELEQQPDKVESLRYHEKRLFRLRAERPRRIANGFACLGFVMVGIPVAIWSRSSDNMSVFFKCFLPILMVYYPLLVTGETIARAGIAPELSVWIADAVLFAVGGYLVARAMRK